ncbi:hypothetical protein VU05_00375 [Desulfobulbus sp. F1]|nr:hypothetical protein [Desulfobulbus sp. F1]
MVENIVADENKIGNPPLLLAKKYRKIAVANLVRPAVHRVFFSSKNVDAFTAYLLIFSAADRIRTVLAAAWSYANKLVSATDDI